jgi:putative nucleotidyltransferase with HDIG domain
VEKTNKTILFVDDEHAILDMVYEYFSLKGYDVYTAENGVEAVKILAIHKIDCCLTDINMPKMDGLQLAEYIRKTDNTIPVIIMTGYPSLDKSIQMLQNGVLDFLIKPVNLKHMELSIERVSRERRLFIKNMFYKRELQKKAQLEKVNQELRYKVDELGMLNKIMTHLAGMHTTSDIFKQISDMCTTLIKADDSRFFIMNSDMSHPFEVATATASVPCPFHQDFNALKALGSKPFEKAQNETAVSIRRHVARSFTKDQLPLLIPENRGSDGLSSIIRSFIAVPLVIREKLFGVLTASVINSDNRFSEKELYYLSFITQRAAYAIENVALYENIYDNLLSTLYAFVKMIEARDFYTRLHSTFVARNAVTIAKEMKCNSEELDILNVAGRLHDIGKIGIRDDILLKKGQLTMEEYNEIKKHPQIGSEIIGRFGLWDLEKLIVKHHHERYDGNGYPDQLKKEEIPLLARIVSVADVYDALSSDRVYRRQLLPEDVFQIIVLGSGSQFDPAVVDAFEKCYQRGEIEQSMSDQFDDYFK